ncbi:MAG: glycosyltransferase family 2 protein [Candidatus Paracaedibacter sp.]
MTNLPLVSVIIPTHNRPDFLKKTIQSILNQNYSRLEIIVISNGFSKINECATGSFGDSRITYREQENSGGPSSPRNHGIQLAKGEYIAFCDDDDLWMPDKLEKQVKVLFENSDVGLCYTNMIRFDEQTEWVVSQDNGKADFNSLLYVNMIPVSSIIVRKSLLDKYGLFTESSIVGFSEDYDFVLRHSYYTQLFHIDEYLIKYWSGNQRTTATDNNFSISYYFKYLKGVLGCYYLNFRERRIKFKKMIIISMHQLKLVGKIVLYNMLRKTRIR